MAISSHGIIRSSKHMGTFWGLWKLGYWSYPILSPLSRRKTRNDTKLNHGRVKIPCMSQDARMKIDMDSLYAKVIVPHDVDIDMIPLIKTVNVVFVCGNIPVLSLK